MHKIKKMIQKKNKKDCNKNFKKLKKLTMNNRCMALIKNINITYQIFGNNANIFYNKIY